MTLAQLNAKREEFWDTRVQGRPEMWAALRVAAEAGDVDTTAAILESAGLTPFDVDENTPPEHCFSYDPKGFKHFLPFYCIYTPPNIVPEQAQTTTATAAAPGKPPLVQVQAAPNANGGVAPQEEKDNTGASAPSTVRVSSASSSGVSGKLIKFKLRFSNGLPDMMMEERSGLTLSQLKGKILARHPDLGPENKIFLFYLGKPLSGAQWTLSQVGLRKDMVLQVFITKKTQQ